MESETFGMECALEYSRENPRRRPDNQELFRAQRNAHHKELQGRLPRKSSSSVGRRKRFTTELHRGEKTSEILSWRDRLQPLGGNGIGVEPNLGAAPFGLTA
jgi:hypothetical protein